jgi:hypothetical protein
MGRAQRPVDGVRHWRSAGDNRPGRLNVGDRVKQGIKDRDLTLRTLPQASRQRVDVTVADRRAVLAATTSTSSG